MIKIVRVGKGSWKVVILCDQCNKPIVGQGNMEFELNEEFGSLPKTGTPFFTHKECDWAFIDTHPGHWVWEDIGAFLRILVDNAKVDIDKAHTWNELLGFPAEKD